MARMRTVIVYKSCLSFDLKMYEYILSNHLNINVLSICFYILGYQARQKCLANCCAALPYCHILRGWLAYVFPVERAA